MFAGQSMNATSAVEPQRTTQVQTSVENLAQITATLEGFSSALEQRLGAVLRSVPPTQTAGTAKPREVMVSLADIIANNCENLHVIAHRLDGIMTRLEL